MKIVGFNLSPYFCIVCNMNMKTHKKGLEREADLASNVNNIDLKTATNADWTLIYDYIKSATNILAHIWRVFDDYLIEETVCITAEKVNKFKDSYDPAYRLTTWISTIIKNTWKDNLDKFYERKNKLVSITDNKGNLTVDYAEDNYAADNYDKALNMIYDYLDGLDESDRTIMEMTLKGEKTTKIAKAIHKTENAVNIRKCRVRKDICENLRNSVLEVLFQTA